MVVISPCDAIEARKATIAAAKTKTPVYIRLAREKTPVITSEETPFEIGKSEIFWESKDPLATIIATGSLVYRALLAAKSLEENGIGTIVLNLSTIKPLDKKTILNAAQRTKGIVTVEEHQVAGGMGSAVAEFLAENHPMRQEFIGVRDQFGQSGTMDELIAHYHMDTPDIIEAVKRAIKRKQL